VNKATGRKTATALAWGAAAALAYLVYLVMKPFLIALAWAGVLAVVVYPMHARLAKRWGPARAALASTVMATAILVVPTLLVAVVFVREALDAAVDLQRMFAEGRFRWIEQAADELQRRLPPAVQVDVSALATDTVRNAAAFVLTRSGLVLRDLGIFVVNLAIALFATFFLLRDSAVIMRTIRRLMPMDESDREHALNTTRELISVGVTSAAIVAAVQGFLGGVVFALVGLEAPVFWGVLMAFLCVLPFGAWVIWAPAAVMLVVNGHTGRGVVLAIAGAAIVSGADNVLRPMLLSGRSHINGLVIFLSLLGGLAAFGALGVVLGPVVVVTALGLVSGTVHNARRDT
jgi:predicted PurR-regulated permease PerM